MNDQQRPRGRPRKHQPSYNFKPPVYNSPLGYQYTQPIFFNTNIAMPVAQSGGPDRGVENVITPDDFSYEPRVKRKAAIKSISTTKKRKQSEEESSISEKTSFEESHVEEDPHERLLEYKDGKYLVKFRNFSYLHCDWINEEDITSTRTGAIKAKKFKPFIVPPEYTQVERILAEGADEDNKDTVLVKWAGLIYDNSTIELVSDAEKCDGFKEAYEDFKQRKKMRQSMWPIEWRPEKSKHIKYVESRKYKGGNTLRPYQLEGINWLLNRWYWKQSCIMADEMGLGKTVQSVCFVEALSKEYQYNHPVIVVAPLSTLVHWEREFKAWTDLRVLTYHGTIQGRDIIAEYEFSHQAGNISVCMFDVILTTFEMAMSGLDHLNKFEYSVAIIDEAHRLKNAKSKASKALRSLRVDHKVLLTGTPIQNNLTELWALFNFIDPQRFASLDSFLQEYRLSNSKDVEKLQLLLKPLMLRRMKEDVETSIPSKEETIIEVELTMTQKRYYRAILEKNLEFLQNNSKKNVPNLINAMMELRKCCIHPYLLKGAEESIIKDYIHRGRNLLDTNEVTTIEEKQKTLLNAYNPDKPVVSLGFDLYYRVLIQSSGKLVLLDKLLTKLHGKHKVLIFSQMTKCLDLLAEYLQYRKFKYERIDGGVRGDLRQAAIDRFSTDDSFVFLLCTRAGGVGINLTAADTCVIFDSDWNPQNDLQAQARCHRIGQKKQVKIYRLVTKNSYEREMFDKAGLKLGLDKAVLQRMSFADNDQAPKQTQDKGKGEAIQLLLRKGAYGVLMDDEDADKFCEEDIDQILERRTKVIKHEDGGNAFSKATFQVEEEVDDPFFWDNLLTNKKASEKEGRIKRQTRKLARDGEIVEVEKLQELLDYYTDKSSNIEYNEAEDLKDMYNDEKDFFILFLEVLVNGLKNIPDKFDLATGVCDKKIKELYKYCLDMVGSDKLKLDFIEQMGSYVEPYEVDMFELQSKMYLKYHEQFLFRIQIPVLMYKVRNDVKGIEKSRGFTREEDLMISEKLVKSGYGQFDINGKDKGEINQRVRKILSVLYHKKDVKDYDNLYLKAILNFGRVTELNRESVERFIERDTKNLEELVDKICNMSKRARKDTPEADCYERILFFDRIEEIDEFKIKRSNFMPKGWNKDEELRDYLLTEGFENVHSAFNITEDVVVKRLDIIAKAESKE